MFIATKIVLNKDGTIISREGFEYSGPVSLLCGASQDQQAILTAQQNFYSFLTSAAQQEFTKGMSVFNDIFSAMSPIVAAGPNQQGFSKPELSALQTGAEENTAQAYRQASQAAREQEAAVGGNQFIPTGGTAQINAEIAAQGAGQVSNELNQITQADYATGRQNFFAAENALSGATNVFNPVTGASGAANQGGSDAANTANQIAQQNNSWLGAVSGALGGVAGAAMTGGMSNLGKGVGFLGQNAPAPS